MSWNIQKYDVRIKLLDPLLGTVPASPSIYAEHVATKQSKAMKKEGRTEEEIEEEIGAMTADIPEGASGLTTFARNEQGYYLRDYQIRGFLKDSARALKQFGPLKQLHAKLCQFVFVSPREILLPVNELLLVERPLRATGPQGPRTAIARSHAVPAGVELSFTLTSLQEVISSECLKTLLQYGEVGQGLGQWRSAGNGRFEVVEFSEQ